jgi:hypothetical protein
LLGMLEEHRHSYHHYRPRSVFDYQTPVEFVT